MTGMILFRADHELIGRVLAEKLRRRMKRVNYENCVRIAGTGDLMTVQADQA